MDKEYRDLEKAAILDCLNSYEPFREFHLKYRVKIVNGIERSCYNAAIEKANSRNIPKFWDDQRFVELYSNIGMMIKMNLDCGSSINNKSDRIKYYVISRIYNYALYQYLKKNQKIFPLNVLTLIFQYIPNINVSQIGSMSSIQLNPLHSTELLKEVELREQQKINVKYSTRYQCHNCGERKVQMKEEQTRSIDEGGTLLLTCVACGHNWKKYNE